MRTQYNANLRENTDSQPQFLSNKILLNLKSKKYNEIVQILKGKNNLNERENFLMGFTLFKTKNYKDAIKYLKN